MQQTISINLAGLVFHIEKDAFNTLRQYLDQIKKSLSGNESQEEIVQDIESRIAEIFQERLSSRKEAVSPEDVQAVKAALGEPETFKSENMEESSANEKENNSGSYTRKGQIHRDIDNKIIGGVCSGISQYYRFDPVWLRLAFVIALLVSGFGIIIYLVLWIILPAAKTPIQKMEMRGERVTVSNIEKSFSSSSSQGSKKSDDNNNSSKFRDTKNSFEAESKNLLKKALHGLETGFSKLGDACRRATTKMDG